jgi:hypothetical protein
MSAISGLTLPHFSRARALRVDADAFMTDETLFDPDA